MSKVHPWMLMLVLAAVITLVANIVYFAHEQTKQCYEKGGIQLYNGPCVKIERIK